MYSMYKYIYIYTCTYIWLVVSTPLKNMSSSAGIIIPNIWKVIKIHGSKPKNQIDIYIYTYAIICIHDFSASFMDLRSALSPLIGSTTHTRFDPTRFGPSNVAKSPAQRAAQRAVSACHGHGSVLGSWANVP